MAPVEQHKQHSGDAAEAVRHIAEEEVREMHHNFVPVGSSGPAGIAE